MKKIALSFLVGIVATIAFIAGRCSTAKERSQQIDNLSAVRDSVKNYSIEIDLLKNSLSEKQAIILTERDAKSVGLLEIERLKKLHVEEVRTNAELKGIIKVSIERLELTPGSIIFMVKDTIDVLPNKFPVFPVPPPMPSAVEDLTDRFLSIATRLKDVDETLSFALEQNGYSRKSYFYVPNGFALVTQLEQIDENGYSIPEPNRWTTMSTSYHQSRFTLTDYIYSLFNAKPGYYRCIAFVITTDLYSFSNKSPTKEETNNWLNEGLIKLPREIGEMEFANEYSILAIIYEFKKLENENIAKLNAPSAISGKQHLINSRILNSIVK